MVFLLQAPNLIHYRIPSHFDNLCHSLMPFCDIAL
jgi:hypothetical protein